MERSGVAWNGNGRMGRCCGVVRMCRECDRLVWNVVEGLEPNRGVWKWCQSHGSGLSEILCDKVEGMEKREEVQEQPIYSKKSAYQIK